MTKPLNNAKNRLRWIAKKTARYVVASFGAPNTRISDVGRVRVLTYHRFGNALRDPFCVAERDFEAQISWLAKTGRTVSLDQLIEFVTHGRPLPDGSCLVTIDDGMVSTLSIAAPILERHKVSAVAFVSPQLIDGNSGSLPERYLSWEELKVLSGISVMEIGSHSMSHQSMGALSIDQVMEDATRSRSMLEDRLAIPIRAYAYPFGMLRDFSSATDDALRRAGYKVAFNSMHGCITHSHSLVSLPRVKVEGGESLKMFKSICDGAMDPWRRIDERLWRLQGVRTAR